MLDSPQLARYQILDRLGGGGFANVYRAVDQKNGETVALKVLLPQYAESAEFRARFLNEAHTILGLPPHPNIVRVRDYAATAQSCYLVMELLQGQDLDQWIEKRGILPVNEATTIAMQIADALALAHQHGIVHRDIKPQNVRITPSGVKVMDFGIARATEAARLTRTDTIIGTPQYIAPEIWEGQRATPRSDVYSLGVVLYEMLAGRAPFDGDTPAAVMRKHLVEYPAPLEKIRHDTPTQLQWITMQALAKQPNERYADGGEMLAAFQGRITVSPPQTKLPSKPIRAPTPISAPRTNLDVAVKKMEQLARSVSSSLGQPAGGMLVGRAGDVTGYRFRLARDIIIGRDRRCLIPLNDRFLSNFHARIFFAHGRYYLMDMQSRNGTWLNEQLVREPVLLEEGDSIRVGECVFKFYGPRSQAKARKSSSGYVADERLLAAIGHGAIVLVPLIAPLAILLMYGSRSPFLEHQTKQALVYQAILCVVFLMSLVFTFIPFILIWLAMVAGGFYAAWRCYQGAAFEYPLLGEQLRPRR